MLNYDFAIIMIHNSILIFVDAERIKASARMMIEAEMDWITIIANAHKSNHKNISSPIVK